MKTLVKVGKQLHNDYLMASGCFSVKHDKGLEEKVISKLKTYLYHHNTNSMKTYN